jgi:hypothetical protein
MNVPRACFVAAVLILGATHLQARERIEADPNELYERTLGQIANGELPAAAASLSRLRSLVTRGRDWDPEGTFARDLLPPLQERLARLQETALRLDAFAARALRGLEPPDFSGGLSTVRDYTEWATAAIRDLRDERDRILEAARVGAADRAALMRTESYARTERVLETGVLTRVGEAAGDDIVDLLAGDPGLESVLLRLRQLKQELMRVMAERDDLERQVEQSRARQEALNRALADVVTDDNPADGAPRKGRPVSAASHFASFLNRQHEALRRRGAVTTAEREALRASLARYDRYNRALAAAGLGEVQGDRIRLLEESLEALPESQGFLAGLPPAAWIVLLGMAALALAAAIVSWLALLRSRRPEAVQGSGAGD